MTDAFLFAGCPENGVVVDQLPRHLEVNGFLCRQERWQKECIKIDQLIDPEVLDGEGIHQALQEAHTLSGVGLLTVVWLYDSSQDHDNDLQAAILRCYLCQSARVVAINVANVTGDAALSGCWISDLLPIVCVRSFDAISSRPLWSGPCWWDDKSLLAEVYEAESQSNQFSTRTAYIDVCDKIRLSSIHACLLEETYTVKITCVSELFVPGLFDEADCGFIVRAHIPVFDEPKSKYEQSLKAIRTTHDWRRFILDAQNISIPDGRPTGPVCSVFYLLHPFLSSSRDDTCKLSKLNPHPLADTLSRVSQVPIPVSDCVDVSKYIMKKIVSNEVESIYNRISETQLPIAESMFSDYFNLSQGRLDEAVSRWLENSNSWSERLALSEHTERKLAIAELNRQSTEPESDVTATDAAEVQVELTLETVLKRFSSDGIPQEAKHQLPAVNRETPGLRLAKWPECLMYDGPGISYHKDDDDLPARVSDPRLLVYRDTRGFSETASIYNSSTTFVTMETPINKPQDNSSNAKQATKMKMTAKNKYFKNTGKSRSISGAKAQDTRLNQSRSNKSAKPSTRIAPGPSSSRAVSGGQQKLREKFSITTESGIQPSEKSTSAASSSAETQPEGKMERNKRNEARLREAVEKALHKHRLSKSHKSYDEIYKLLYQVTFAAVKKLETSHDLERRIKSIANKFAGPMVATMAD